MREATMRTGISSVFALLVLTILAPAGVSPAAAQQPLEAEGQAVGSKVVIRDLKRDDGGTVTLRFQISNEDEKPLKTYGLLGEYYAMDKVHLVDAKNKKKYLAVKDSAHKCLCSELKQDIAKGAKFNLWAKFPAPPADVQKVSVIIPGFEPIEAVPITAR
jgi:hypothetical protein